MALEFRRRIFRMPNKKAQYAIAFTALLIVLAVVFCWMIIKHKIGQMNTGGASDDSLSEITVTEEFTAADKSNLLLIFTDEGSERFILLQADPQDSCVRVAPIPSALYTQNDLTLTELYRKHGAARAVRAVSDAIDLPLRHYVAMSGEKAVSWFNHLENGLLFSVPESVDYTAADGSITRLTAGEHNLTASQTIGLMRYDGWRDTALLNVTSAQIIANMLNQYLHTDRYLENDFATLSNLAQTSLRIGDYNDARAVLTHLAESNVGNLASVITLATVHDTDHLTLDLNTIKKKAIFHDQ